MSPALNKQLNVAVIGCGWVAGDQITRGFAIIPDRFRVVACCDRDLGKAQAFAETHGIEHACESVGEVLADPRIDVVSICTPPSLHHAMVRDALAAGKQVICEKPFTSSLSLMDDVIALERQSPGRVMPIFQYRFARGIQRARHLIASGFCGTAYLSTVETAWRRQAEYYDVAWRGKFATELGGVLVTQAIHIHDLFLWLMGPATAVKAFKTTRVNPIEVEDCAVASLEMADGSLASLAATLGSAVPTTRFRLCFERLTIERQCYGTDAPKPGDDPWTVLAADPAVAEQARRIMDEAPDLGADFAGQFADFHDAVCARRPFLISLEDARRSLELITALYHSAETGETVALPITSDHPRYRGWHVD